MLCLYQDSIPRETERDSLMQKSGLITVGRGRLCQQSGAHFCLGELLGSQLVFQSLESGGATGVALDSCGREPLTSGLRILLRAAAFGVHKT